MAYLLLAFSKTWEDSSVTPPQGPGVLTNALWKGEITRAELQLYWYKYKIAKSLAPHSLTEFSFLENDLCCVLVAIQWREGPTYPSEFGTWNRFVSRPDKMCKGKRRERKRRERGRKRRKEGGLGIKGEGEIRKQRSETLFCVEHYQKRLPFCKCQHQYHHIMLRFIGEIILANMFLYSNKELSKVTCHDWRGGSAVHANMPMSACTWCLLPEIHFRHVWMEMKSLLGISSWSLLRDYFISISFLWLGLSLVFLFSSMHPHNPLTLVSVPLFSEHKYAPPLHNHLTRSYYSKLPVLRIKDLNVERVACESPLFCFSSSVSLQILLSVVHICVIWGEICKP